MGVDLKLFPFDADLPDLAFSHQMLSLERNRALWEAIEPIMTQHGAPVPDRFTTFYGRRDDGESEYGETITDAYGSRVQYVLAKYLKPLTQHPGVIGNYKNRAAWAYINECPDDTKIALYWH